jgi:hypothetical protein
VGWRGEAFPSFRASREGRDPLRRTASFRRPPTKREYAGGGGGVHLYFRYPSGQELRAASLYTWGG